MWEKKIFEKNYIKRKSENNYEKWKLFFNQNWGSFKSSDSSKFYKMGRRPFHYNGHHQVPIQRKFTTSTQSWIIFCVFLLCVNFKQTNADVKELTGKCSVQVPIFAIGMWVLCAVHYFCGKNVMWWLHKQETKNPATWLSWVRGMLCAFQFANANVSKVKVIKISTN